MTVAEFAEFFRRQRHRVIAGDTCYWHAYRPFVFISLPYHRALAPSSSEVLRVLLTGPAAAVRFPTDVERGDRRMGIFLCSDRNYGFSSLQPRMRSYTRRGLENCTVEPVDFGYLAQHGHQLNVESFERQGRDARTMTESQWHRYCETARAIPGFEAWGAWVSGHLAAFLVVARVEDSFYIHHQSSATDYLQLFSNHALTFTVTQTLIGRPEVNSVCYGQESLVTPGIDIFKSRMGFDRRPFGERIALNPLLELVLSLGGRRIIHWAARKRPESRMWQKVSLFLARNRT